MSGGQHPQQPTSRPMPSPITKAGQFSSSNSNTDNSSSGGVGLVAKGVAITAMESVALTIDCWIVVVGIMLVRLGSGVALLELLPPFNPLLIVDSIDMVVTTLSSPLPEAVRAGIESLAVISDETLELECNLPSVSLVVGLLVLSVPDTY